MRGHHICLLLAVAVKLAVAVSTGPTPPNFVVVLVDDWAFGDLGANGFGAETPNLDALAAKGMRFTDMHANSVCTPSRTALLTGRYNMRYGVNQNFDTDSEGGLALGEITIGQLLQTRNYSTIAIGKWHAGHAVNYHPTWRGFDSYLGPPYSLDMGCVNTALTENGTRKHGCHDSGPANQGSPALPLYNSTTPRCTGVACSSTIVEQPADLTTLDGHYVDAANRFFVQHAAGGPLHDRPFLAYIPLSHVHVPLSHNPRFQNASVRNTLFADTLLEMDDTVGRIVQSLADHGLAESTLTLIVGDNGPWNFWCDQAGSQGNFTGAYMATHGGGGTGKFTNWEGGHREASIAYWPGTIAAGSISHATLHVIDYLPTLAALAGVPLPSDRHYDGVDASQVLLHNAPSVPRDFLFHQLQSATGNFSAARYKNFKAHWGIGSTIGCGEKATPYVWQDTPLIFDLDVDPAETVPLANPPPGIVDSFNAALAALLDDIKGSYRTVSNYSRGGFPAWPCCNATQPDCQCSVGVGIDPIASV